MRLGWISRGGLYLVLSLLLIAALALLLDRLFPPDLSRFQHTSVLVLDNQDDILRGFTTSEDSWRLPLQPNAVDPLYLRMLKAYEDRRFDWHFGVDPLAVIRAARQWIAHGRVVSGASTLTMQTARLLEPRPRTLTGKLMEMLRAVQLEWRFDKDDILTAYLTLAPYGGNLEGLRAASLAYLGKTPRHLTPAQAALLVVLPQAPSLLRPDRFPERARAARNKVLARMGQLGHLTSRQVTEALREAVPATRYPMPFHAPHLARRLRQAEPHRPIHKTFIDSHLQHTLEAMARQQPLEPHANLAILVVENVSQRVIAYLGGADFFATERAGQVDMARAMRSPGSTLKPVVYGLGFDDSIIHPETLIDDTPTRFGDYSPTNFRNHYLGQISVREALQRSQNIPAVAVLDRLGPARVAARLREANIRLRWGKAHPKPGLPLVLGGVGTTLADLVTLYTGIANGGVIRPLHITAPSIPPNSPLPKVGEERRLLSASASWYLARILEEAPQPEAVVALGNTRRPRPIAYKTGTSYGFRDAWALGFDGDRTVGVWVGRPDGSPSPGHYGRNTAAPLLFRIFELLPVAEPRPASVIPEGVLLAHHGELPERLKYFGGQADRRSGPALTIGFPLHGSTVELAVREGRLQDLPLVAKGGKKPLRWWVNGRPLDASVLHRKAYWSPDGEGLARIAVVDGQGRTARAEVWIEMAIR